MNDNGVAGLNAYESSIDRDDAEYLAVEASALAHFEAAIYNVDIEQQIYTAMESINSTEFRNLENIIRQSKSDIFSDKIAMAVGQLITKQIEQNMLNAAWEYAQNKWDAPREYDGE